MAKLQKYLFDLDFGTPAADGEMSETVIANEDVIAAIAEEPPAPPPITFSEEELSLARDQAYEAGRQAGWQEAEADSARMASTALAVMAQQLEGLATAQQVAAHDALRESVAVAVAVVRKLLPEFARRHALDEIEGVVMECLGQLDRQPKVTIRINPGQLDAVREGAQRAAEAVAFEGRLICHADPRVAPGNCCVEWGDGGAERDQARLWAEIEAVIERALAAQAIPADGPPRQDILASA